VEDKHSANIQLFIKNIIDGVKFIIVKLFARKRCKKGAKNKITCFIYLRFLKVLHPNLSRSIWLSGDTFNHI
jgi:hypothetical protein